MVSKGRPLFRVREREREKERERSCGSGKNTETHNHFYQFRQPKFQFIQPSLRPLVRVEAARNSNLALSGADAALEPSREPVLRLSDPSLSTKTEYDYLNGWSKKKMATCAKTSPKMVNSGGLAGERRRRKPLSTIRPVVTFDRSLFLPPLGSSTASMA